MTFLYFILLIGVLIFVHELGHFLFAKLFKVKVLKFVLGFGPRALGFRRGETEYVIAWLPLGGYVKMFGDDPNDEIRVEDQSRSFNHKPLWQRYIIVFAGPAFNLIFPTVIYFFFYAAQAELPPSVMGKVFAGKPAAEAGLQPGDRIVAIDGDRVRYWEDMQRTVSDHPGESLRFTIMRDGKTFDRHIVPEKHPQRNRLGLKQFEGRIGIANYFERVQIGISAPDSPAGQAGLQTGDLVSSVDGRPVRRFAELERVLHRSRGKAVWIDFFRPSESASSFADLHLLIPHRKSVTPEARMVDGRRVYETGIHSAEFFVTEVEEGSPAAKMGMRAGDRVTHLNGKPLDHWEVIQMTLQAQLDAEHTLSWIPYGGKRRTGRFKLARVTYLDEYRAEQERYVFGAQNRLLRRFAEPVPIEGRFTYAVTEAVRRTGEIVGVIAIAFVQIFRGAIPRDTIGGPVMLFHTAGVAARKGWDHFLSMMALISINLGILNLLPIPILDGGHIMFFTVEAIKRRPLSLRAREVASYVGLFLLVSLMVFAFKNDIVRYWF